MRRCALLPEDDVTEVRHRWAIWTRCGVDADTTRHRDHAYTGPKPPFRVDRFVFLDWHWLLAHELGSVAASLLVLEIRDELLDGVLVVGVGLELQILLEAEDRLVVVTEVPVAL